MLAVLVTAVCWHIYVWHWVCSASL